MIHQVYWIWESLQYFAKNMEKPLLPSKESYWEKDFRKRKALVV